MRTELKKKTGVVINELGERLDENVEKSSEDVNNIMLTGGSNNKTKSILKVDKNSKFTPITAYKPAGNLIYDQTLLNIGRN